MQRQYTSCSGGYLTISSCVSVRMSRYWVRWKFGENERGIRVAQGAAECNFCPLSAFQTSQVLNISYLDIRTANA